MKLTKSPSLSSTALELSLLLIITGSLELEVCNKESSRGHDMGQDHLCFLREMTALRLGTLMEFMSHTPGYVEPNPGPGEGGT